MSDVDKCPNCGNILTPDSDFCEKCGQKVDHDDRKGRRASLARSQTTLKILSDDHRRTYEADPGDPIDTYLAAHLLMRHVKDTAHENIVKAAAFDPEHYLDKEQEMRALHNSPGMIGKQKLLDTTPAPRDLLRIEQGLYLCDGKYRVRMRLEGGEVMVYQCVPSEPGGDASDEAVGPCMTLHSFLNL